MFVPDEQNHRVQGIRRAIQRDAAEVLEKAVSRLKRHFVFRAYVESLHLDYQEGTLRVTGQLPSFYLTQVLQTALRDISGVDRVYNQVKVVPVNKSTPSNR